MVGMVDALSKLRAVQLRQLLADIRLRIPAWSEIVSPSSVAMTILEGSLLACWSWSILVSPSKRKTTAGS
jgi:hypothetical protein